MYITSRALLPSLVPIIASEDPKHYSQLAGSESCTKQRKFTAPGRHPSRILVTTA